MSHIIELKTEIRDPVAIQAACQRLGLPQPTSGTFQLFSTTAAGVGVQLPGWRYFVVCNTATGQLGYDNYHGHWKG